MADVSQSLPQVLAGPWRGIEERETYQSDAHCQLAVNVSLHRGLIEGRKGFGTPISRAHVGVRLHVATRPVGPPRILMIGPNASHQINLSVLSLDLTVIAGVNLSTAFNEPKCQHFQASFVEANLLNGHHVTLIVTPATTYIWDPYVSETSVRLPVMATDTVKTDVLTFYYLNHPPKGPIACQHQKRYFYAGFAPMTELALDGALPAAQGDVPETWILPGRDKIRVGPNVVAFSDSLFPLDVHATSFIALPEDEAVTGLRSFHEQLVMLTDRAVYVLAGDPGLYGGGAQVLRVVVGSGCVAPASVVEVQGALYYLGTDGIYAFDGQAARKISKPLDSHWTGEQHGDRVPGEISALLRATLRWPWRVDGRLAHTATAVHRQTENQIWFSLPTLGGYRFDSVAIANTTILPLIVVYDYAHDAWTLFKRRSALDLATSAVSWVDGGRERTYLAQGEKIAEYGAGAVDDADGIPVVYLSARHAKGNERGVVWGVPYLTSLSWGRTPGSNPPRWMLEGMEAPFDVQLAGAANASRQQWAADVQMHPHQDNTYFLGTGTLGATGTMLLTPQAFWSQRLQAGAVNSKWWRLGLLDDSQSTARSPSLVVQSYAMLADTDQGGYA